MSDKAQPGKDKDLRYIKRAINEADEVYQILSGKLQGELPPLAVELATEAMLLAIEQYDELHQMLDDPAATAATVIEQNRLLRNLLKLMMQEKLPPAWQVNTANMIRALGDQLRSLMVTKEIRGVRE